MQKPAAPLSAATLPGGRDSLPASLLGGVSGFSETFPDSRPGKLPKARDAVQDGRNAPGLPSSLPDFSAVLALLCGNPMEVPKSGEPSAQVGKVPATAARPRNDHSHGPEQLPGAAENLTKPDMRGGQKGRSRSRYSSARTRAILGIHHTRAPSA